MPKQALSKFLIGVQAIAMLASLQVALPADEAPRSRSAAEVYNSGITAYQAEEYARAIESFRHAAAADEDRLAADARYNLGNALVAKHLADSDPSGSNFSAPNRVQCTESQCTESDVAAAEQFRRSLLPTGCSHHSLQELPETSPG